MVLLVGAVVIGLYMAWNIGANDVANAMGTSVGSRSLTFRQAVVFAAIFEFAGAVLVGTHVSETVRKGIVDPMHFVDNPQVLMIGMFAALLASALWLNVATFFGQLGNGYSDDLAVVDRHDSEIRADNGFFDGLQ